MASLIVYIHILGLLTRLLQIVKPSPAKNLKSAVMSTMEWLWHACFIILLFHDITMSCMLYGMTSKSVWRVLYWPWFVRPCTYSECPALCCVVSSLLQINRKLPRLFYQGSSLWSLYCDCWYAEFTVVCLIESKTCAAYIWEYLDLFIHRSPCNSA